MIAALLWLALPAGAVMTPAGASVSDLTGLARTNYSSNEFVMFSQSVFSTDASTSSVVFKFQVFGPSGASVFTQTGNAAPGSAGTAETHLAGIALTNIAKTSGLYRLVCTATRGTQSLTQEADFTVQNPNLTLTYPSNGASNVPTPLALTWVASGASQYRVTVGDNPAFYNSVFTQTVPGTQNQLVYPQDPPDTRQRLVAGTVYYWKVDGLDASGNLQSSSQIPFSFTIQPTAATITRDLAITRLDVTQQPRGPLSEIPLIVTLANQGGTTENNVTVKLEVGGNSANGSPATVPVISPGQKIDLNFSAIMPPDQPNALAVACDTLFDDVPMNNCMTLRIAQVPTVVADTTTISELRAERRTAQQAWDLLRERIGDPAVIDELKDYRPMELLAPTGMSDDAVYDLLEAIDRGDAKVTGAHIE